MSLLSELKYHKKGLLFCFQTIKRKITNDDDKKIEESRKALFKYITKEKDGKMGWLYIEVNHIVAVNKTSGH